jgi:3-oxoacyl-[acyl-carrier-protein] synthase-3
MFKSVITGTGACIPTEIQLNEAFIHNTFLEENGQPIATSPENIIEKFGQITGIRERRYVSSQLKASDIAVEAAREAIKDSGVDPETLDQIIVAHNFGNIGDKVVQGQTVPSLANLVKHALGIRRPECIAYDLVSGCPGWVQSLIQSHAYFKAGMASKVLLIGTETLSRVLDPYDRDSMMFSDGAGACVMEYRDTGKDGSGIMATCAQTHSLDEIDYINMGRSYSQSNGNTTRYIKMKGRKVYEYAIKYVPPAIKQCLDECGIGLQQVKKIFIHQANEKLDDGILKRLCALYDLTEPPPGIMPMSIQWLGNSSVATVPTLYDMVRKGKLPSHELHPGDIIVFASVGAGMNISGVCYRV